MAVVSQKWRKMGTTFCRVIFAVLVIAGSVAAQQQDDPGKDKEGTTPDTKQVESNKTDPEKKSSQDEPLQVPTKSSSWSKIKDLFM